MFRHYSTARCSANRRRFRPATTHLSENRRIKNIEAIIMNEYANKRLRDIFKTRYDDFSRRIYIPRK